MPAKWILVLFVGATALADSRALAPYCGAYWPQVANEPREYRAGKTNQQVIDEALALPYADNPYRRIALAQIYRTLQWRYRFYEGRVDLEKRFMQIVEKWKKSPGYPPGLDDHFNLTNVHSVDDYVKLVPGYDRNHRSQPTQTLYGLFTSYAQMVAEGSTNPKWSDRARDYLEDFLVIRAVLHNRYYEPPDQARFP